jgi:hypothetical protein
MISAERVTRLTPSWTRAPEHSPPPLSLRGQVLPDWPESWLAVESHDEVMRPGTPRLRHCDVPLDETQSGL